MMSKKASDAAVLKRVDTNLGPVSILDGGRVLW